MSYVRAVIVVFLVVCCAFAPLAVGAAPGAADDPAAPAVAGGESASTIDGGTGETLLGQRANGSDLAINLTLTNGSVRQASTGEIFVWRPWSTTVSTQFSPDPDTEVRVCVNLYPDSEGNGTVAANSSATLIDCATVGTSVEGYTVTRSFTINGWPTNTTRDQVVSAVVRNTSTSAVLGQVNETVTVIQPDGDFDGDRLPNKREAGLGTSINGTDSDTDGLEDGPEVLEYGTDPLKNDTDGDGLNDAREVDGSTNATDPDTDGDGLEDGAEVHEYDTVPSDPDSDDDGLDDGVEVRGETDPNVADTDGDGLEDGAEVNVYDTDPTDPDTDGDGLDDSLEVSMGSDPTNGFTIVFVAVLLLTVLGLVVLARRRLVPDLPWTGTGDGDDSGERAGGGSTRGGEPVGSDPEPIPPGMLSDEDRVIQLLRQDGGRLPQNEITKKTDWSKSKVSRLLSSMEEEGDIEKINVGRQNIIALEDAVPDNAKSPFEETQIDGE